MSERADVADKRRQARDAVAVLSQAMEQLLLLPHDLGDAPDATDEFQPAVDWGLAEAAAAGASVSPDRRRRGAGAGAAAAAAARGIDMYLSLIHI